MSGGLREGNPRAVRSNSSSVPTPPSPQTSGPETWLSPAETDSQGPSHTAELESLGAGTPLVPTRVWSQLSEAEGSPSVTG